MSEEGNGASPDPASDLEESLRIYQKARKLQNMGLAFNMYGKKKL